LTPRITPEGRYLLDFDTRELPRFGSDVLVIGGGIAGLSAALAAANAGASVILLAKSGAQQSNTAWAQGGIAVALDSEDSFDSHAADTERTGAGLCDMDVVRRVIEGAPAAFEELVELGARFDREDGGYALGREGGHSHRRIVHAQGDATGAEVVRALSRVVDRHAGIRRHAHGFMVDLLTHAQRCVGAIVRKSDGGEYSILARSVVMAAGGAGRLFRETSNSRGATGDGIAAAFRAGADLRDLEFVQFHPTTLYLAGSDRVLVTEAVRGEGAHLVDDEGRRFLAEVHPDGELAPRDVVSRAIVRHLQRPDVHDVFLDLRHWTPGLAARRFPGLYATCARYGLDPERDRIPVRPAAHYLIGGVTADCDGHTSLDGLFACGEASCTGLHGANRLASNSLLEGLVLGRRTGRAAASEMGDRFDGEIAHRTGRAAEGRVDIEDLRKSLVSRMWRSAGVLREEEGLHEAAAAIEIWRRFLGSANLHGRAGFELENLLLLGALVVGAARRREESRGTHTRLDFVDRDDEHQRGSYHWRRDAESEFKPLGESLRVREG
jgi:L-aspartate oxidase